MTKTEVFPATVALPEQVLNLLQDAQAQNTPQSAPVQRKNPLRPSIREEMLVPCQNSVRHLDASSHVELGNIMLAPRRPPVRDEPPGLLVAGVVS